MREHYAAQAKALQEAEAANWRKLEQDATELAAKKSALRASIAEKYPGAAAILAELMRVSMALDAQQVTIERRAAQYHREGGGGTLALGNPVTIHRAALIPSPDGDGSVFDGRVPFHLAGLPFGVQAYREK